MARFTVRLDAPSPPAEAWRRIWNLDAHTRVIPLTTLRGDGTDGTPLRVGSRFTARTALGPVRIDDVMEVRRFEVPPPGATVGHASVIKTGRIIGGDLDVTVEPRPGGSRVRWTQDITLRGVPTAADPVVATAARLAYGTVLRRLLRGS